jgi:hypothetical protein
MPSWVTEVIEILVGAFLAAFFFWLGYRSSEKVREMTERIDERTELWAKGEQEYKDHQCKIIIEELQGIQDAEQKLKSYLTGYKVGDPNNILMFQGMALDGLANSSIYNMKDAIGQLQGMLNNKSLRKEFSDYLGAFYVLPKMILEHKQYQQEHQLDFLRHFAGEQMEKIQAFIDRFKEERSDNSP